MVEYIAIIVGIAIASLVYIEVFGFNPKQINWVELDSIELFERIVDPDLEHRKYIKQCEAELLEWDMWMNCHLYGCDTGYCDMECHITRRTSDIRLGETK